MEWITYLPPEAIGSYLHEEFPTLLQISRFDQSWEAEGSKGTTLATALLKVGIEHIFCIRPKPESFLAGRK